MCLDASAPSRLQYHQQCHSHTSHHSAPWRAPHKQHQTNKNNHLGQISNTKMQIAMSKKKRGRLLIFGREGRVETETVLGEMCARLSSVHQR